MHDNQHFEPKKYLGKLASTRNAFRESPSDAIDQCSEACYVSRSVRVNHIFFINFPAI